MIFFELDDFEWLVDEEKGEDITEFSYLFVIYIDWAYKRDLLSKKFMSDVVYEKYHKMVRQKITMSEFVLDALDGKLLSSYFKKEIVSFIEYHYEGGSNEDGLASNLISCTGKAVPVFKTDYFIDFECVYSLMDKSREYYEKEVLPIIKDDKGITINGVFFPDGEVPDVLPNPLPESDND